MWLANMPFSDRAFIIEIAVVGSEAMFYRWLLPLNWRESILVSLIANGASFAIGLLIYSL